MNTSGQTLREYVWLGDMPVAVVDNVNTTPTIYYVQTDHLMRPARMTDANTNWVWDVIYSPFGATATINANPAVMDIRFPGQWFQLETGLAYNWHRHYDATTGRYVQPDPLLDDDGSVSVRGISTDVFGANASANSGYAIADAAGRLNAGAFMPNNYSPRAMLPDGPSLYGYARQSPLTRSDPAGLASGAFSPIPGTTSNACEAPPQLPSNIIKVLVPANDNQCQLTGGLPLIVDGEYLTNCHYICQNGNNRSSFVHTYYGAKNCPSTAIP